MTVMLWRSAAVLFIASLLLPIRADWSDLWAGGWYAYLWGLALAPTTLFYMPVWLARGWPGDDLKASDFREMLFLLTWFANPMHHAAAVRLHATPPKRSWRSVRVLTGLALGLALLAGLIDVGSTYASLQRSPAYFAWLGSMALLFLAALRPRSFRQDGDHPSESPNGEPGTPARNVSGGVQ